jgi:hypothetical protein
MRVSSKSWKEERKKKNWREKKSFSISLKFRDVEWEWMCVNVLQWACNTHHLRYGFDLRASDTRRDSETFLTRINFVWRTQKVLLFTSWLSSLSKKSFSRLKSSFLKEQIKALLVEHLYLLFRKSLCHFVSGWIFGLII